MITYPILGCQGRRLSHDLGHRLGGPVEWMRLLIPFPNELLKLHSQVFFGVKINDAQTFALQDAEPLFYLIHPRAMRGREVDNKAWMMR
jgi:hypothetical protein